MIWIITHTILGDKAGLAYDLVPLDGDLQKVKPLDLSIDIGLWPIQRTSYFRCGRRIGTENLPTKLRAKYDRGGGNAQRSGITLSDYIGVQHSQIVSERFRTLVEMHDPGRHQFEPVSLVWSKAETMPQTYYWFIPATRLFAMDPEKTHPPLDKNSQMFPAVGPVADWKPVYQQSVVSGHSLFVAAELHGIHITSRFKDALEAAGLTGYRIFGPFALAD